jgi:3-dehydroquinate synthase
MSDVSRIRVATDAPYDVVIGRQLAGELRAALGSGARRVAVIHPPALSDRAERLRAALTSDGYEPYRLEVPAGEEAKTAEVAADCWKRLGLHGFTRSDAVIGLGGGSTTDLAGFVAATFLRGITLIHLPTTLLGMVDAAVGGKTGINTEEGKNLVGSFYEPVAVLCDLTCLESLDPAELVAGLGEVIKCGFIADPAILDLIETDPAASTDPGSAACRELVERSIAVKADVVARDFRESTSTGSAVGREMLNYGHTLGHAVERAEGYTFRHGSAVAIGMVFVAELSHLLGRLDRQTADRHREVLASVGLPVSYRGAPWNQLVEIMRIDKKTRGDLLRFVILDAIARPAILEGPDPAALEAAFAAISR